MNVKQRMWLSSNKTLFLKISVDSSSVTPNLGFSAIYGLSGQEIFLANANND